MAVLQQQLNTMSRRMKMLNGNATLTVEVCRPNWPAYRTQVKANIVSGKIYTMTRAFCRETLKQLDGIKGETPWRAVSYTLND